MDAVALRELILDLMLELDDHASSHILSSVLERAARRASGWRPAPPSDAVVAEMLAFTEAAKDVGYADPLAVDELLRQGSSAFLAGAYVVAARLFRALLPSLADCEIDLGQDETVDEVLGADVSVCAAQHVVSVYMTSAPDDRADAVSQAIDEVRGLASFWEPLREMERVAIEPLPDLDDFLPRWRARIESEIEPDRQQTWDEEPDRWRREVVLRMDGTAGLAGLARGTRRPGDLDAWCDTLVQAQEWEAALLAYDEAAEMVEDNETAWGRLLDGAALAAQVLSRSDLTARLERAWRGAPSMPRLCRWLGSAPNRKAVGERAALALEACPERAHRQRAFLHVLLCDYESAADLLSAAPGLGWSASSHPGHLLVPLFQEILGGRPISASREPTHCQIRALEAAELEWTSADPAEPRLVTPTLGEILELVGTGEPLTSAARNAVLEAMRRATEKRLAGVTGHKRRRTYSHAAELVAACKLLDPTPETDCWVAGIRAEYRRYPALQRELDRHLGNRSSLQA